MKMTTKNSFYKKTAAMLRNHSITKAFFASLVVFITIGLNLSCSNDSRIGDADTKTLDQKIFVTPDRYIGEPQDFYESKKNVFVNLNEVVKFTVRYTVNDEYLRNDSISHYESLNWKIDDDSFNVISISYLFNTSGIHFGILKTVDNFKDTLIDTVNVFVNTLEAIQLIYPNDNNNQINPFSDDTQKLLWNIEGLDPWEDQYCAIYESTKSSNVWKKLKKEVSCSEKVNIYDIIENDLKEEIKNNESEEAYTFYWGVKFYTRNESGQIHEAKSNVFRFTTKLQDKDYSIVKIPIVYNYSSTISATPNTNIVITSAHGDTLKTLKNNSREAVVSAKIQPQTGIIIHISDSTTSDFRPRTFSLDVPDQSLVCTDTVFLLDRTPPTIWPISNSFSADDSIKFPIIDGGIEKSASSIIVFVNDTTIHTTYNYPILSFKKEFLAKRTNNIDISASDYAGNWTGNMRWTLTLKNDSLYLSGPTPSLED